ncbi:MAG: glycosyltransferase [Ferruginibacter sp.]
MIVNTFDTVIVLGTYNRGELLARSLTAYQNQRERIAIVVMDDGSTDMTKVHCAAIGTPVFYFYLGDKTGWRDSASFLNQGIKFALNDLKAKYVFITHPEIIPGRETITAAIELAKDKDTWVSCKGYYLTPEQQQHLDQQDWRSDLLSVRHLPRFYGNDLSPEFTGSKDYLPESIEKINPWHSWIFGGGSAEMWRHFGGLTPFEVWGSVDVDLHTRRTRAEMITVTPCQPEAFVVHQNHDEKGTPRDMELCMKSIPDYNIVSPLKPELLL